MVDRGINEVRHVVQRDRVETFAGDGQAKHVEVRADGRKEIAIDLTVALEMREGNFGPIDPPSGTVPEERPDGIDDEQLHVGKQQSHARGDLSHEDHV